MRFRLIIYPDLLFVETSALVATNVEVAFMNALSKVHEVVSKVRIIVCIEIAFDIFISFSRVKRCVQKVLPTSEISTFQRQILVRSRTPSAAAHSLRFLIESSKSRYIPLRNL